MTIDPAALAREAFELAARMRHVPGTTYRMQFHAGFKFRDAAAAVPYLSELGVTDAYASPYLKAAPGSTHGYDITDHRTLNPEVGSPGDHETWIAALHDAGLGLILDIVPNHMGILGNENPWWNDVLENGPSSPWASFFDIDWAAPTRPELRGRVLLPLLGDLYGDVLEKGELQLASRDGGFEIQYHDHRFPIDPGSYATVLTPAVDAFEAAASAEDSGVIEARSIITAIENLPPFSETDEERIRVRQREKQVIKRRIADLASSHPAFAAAVGDAIKGLNGDPNDASSFDGLDRLLDAQPYRLAYWRVAADEINYRRFFDVNPLAAIRTERPEVFAASHALIFDLLARGAANGVRIDHPDGLYDPSQYLERLQTGYLLALARRCAGEISDAEWAELEPRVRDEIDARNAAGDVPRPLYVVVEKILGIGEALPSDWPCDGTSGYDALNQINSLYVDPAREKEFTRLYRSFVDDPRSFADLTHETKLLILETSLASELQMLSWRLERIAQRDRRSRDFSRNALSQAIREVIACYPVYRSYTTREGAAEGDRPRIDEALRCAMQRNPVMSRAIFRFLRDVLLGSDAQGRIDPERAAFAAKFQQVTAPVMAKGVEDTAFYVFNRLVSINEVGGDPARFGIEPRALHEWFAARADRFPHALTSLSTHDTKRSEDVRARINVLSEDPVAWFQAVERWRGLNAPHRAELDDKAAPDVNEEYFFFQNLVGVWPMEELDEKGWETLRDRLRAFMSKSIHESKRNSSWMNPVEDYDKAVDDFVARVIDPAGNAAFFDDFLPFQRRISHFGVMNSLSQTLLRLAAPGVPDTYQGTEVWDFSLVDPDNRRPVDYAERARLLQLVKQDADPKTLLRDPMDGRLKLLVVHKTLQARKRLPELFLDGSYEAVESSGQRQRHVFAFTRRHGETAALVVAPRLFSRLIEPPTYPVGAAVWGDTRLTLPESLRGARLVNAFTGESVVIDDAVVEVAALLATFPVGLFLVER